MEKFLSCDWGTSSFRLRIVEVPGLLVVAEQKSDQGITNSFELWKQSKKSEDDRLIFYLGIIGHHIKILEEKSGTSLNELPLVISGMASSTIGMINLPYKELPFSTDGSDLDVKMIEAGDSFSHKTIIVSGAKSIDDMMRGEETQLVGCFYKKLFDKKDQIFIFPGTHSKHIIVENGKAVAVKTYMTGEFFKLLSKISILSHSVDEGTGLLHHENIRQFEKGVGDSAESNLLHSCFRVRTNHLFGKFTRQENYYYLSGLLIGTEMKELMGSYVNVSLVSNKILSPYYEKAFNFLNKKNSILEIHNADEAIVHGQFKIYKKISEKE
jgi:2-dehydro-3-deoxygalactonokinase